MFNQQLLLTNKSFPQSTPIWPLFSTLPKRNTTAEVQKKSNTISIESPITFEHFGIVFENEQTINCNFADLQSPISVSSINHIKTTKKSTGLRNGSKQQKVVEMMKLNPGLERKEYINMIVEQFGMSKAGASTYHQNGKRHI